MGSDELPLVQEAFATNWIAPLGPHVDAFEREFALSGHSSHAAGADARSELLRCAALFNLSGLRPGGRDELLQPDLFRDGQPGAL